MSYTESQLLPGERVKYRAHLHWLPFLAGYLAGLALLAGGTVTAAMQVSWLLAGVLLVAGVAFFGWTWIAHTTAEFSVTDKRVIIKVGFIQRRTLETLLSKVEGIGVEQSLTGRALNFGTIVVSGTGGTKETFQNIADPLEFRRHVQAEVSATQDTRTALTGAAPAAVRDERECPFCAELILKKAKVCRYCQREVTPID